MYQRLHGGHGFGALHDDILHRLAVGAAAGDAGGVHTLLQNFGRHGALLEPAVGAARAQKLYHIHSQHILASCLCRALPGRHKAAAVLLVYQTPPYLSITVAVRPMPTTASVIFFQLLHPQTPSAVRPKRRCTPFRAVSVLAPNTPSSVPVV